MSPSLWWNNDSAAVRYADLVAHRTAPLRLFVSSGAYEPPIDRTTLRFAARLDSAKNPTVAFGHRRYVERGLRRPAAQMLEGRAARHRRRGHESNEDSALLIVQVNQRSTHGNVVGGPTIFSGNALGLAF